jgi:DNA repair protein SbcD/Mre11
VRFLHTSDWHLGRTLHGEPLLAHQRTFLTWLTALAVDRGVDAVLVAGDVYDRAVPPPDAVALLDDALAGLAAAGVQVVLTSGNHDSAVRLGFGTALAARAGVHLRTRLAELTHPVVFGDVGVYGIPYLLPDAVMAELGAARSHESVLRAAVTKIRTDASRRGLTHVVVLAHAFVTGGAPSESERDITVGGIGDAPAAVFDGIAYAALGHLHGAQQLAPNVRYSGSPLPFSFSERGHRKSVALIDVAVDGAITTELVPTPVPHPLAEIRGRLEELLAAASGPPASAWVRAVLTDPVRPSAPMERLRERWPHTLMLDFQPDVEPVEPAADLARLRQVTDPIEVCSLFVEWVQSTYPDRRQRDALETVVVAVRRAELSA